MKRSSSHCKHATVTKGMYFPLMFDTFTRTRAYVPVILVSSKGLSDGWTDGMEDLVALHHSLQRPDPTTEPESNGVGAHLSSICIYGSTWLLSRFPSMFKQH